MKRFVTLALISCIWSLCAGQTPNILLIVSDDQGWHDAGFNGSKDIPTPNLDALAMDGVVFENGYVSHPYCSPSRAGILTGRYQHRFGHENNTPYHEVDPDAGLPLEEELLSQTLKSADYKTCAIGKWHLGDHQKFWPNSRGFDEWFGFAGGSMSYWGDIGKKDENHGVLHNGSAVPVDSIRYLTDDFTAYALDYIDRNAASPFFMYLAYNAPHMPLHVTSAYLEKTTHIEEGERSAYAAMVAGMDTGIGSIVKCLKEKEIYENTLIVFLSDNGGHTHGASNYPYRGHKGMLFEGGIKVPFVISWPANIPNGSYEAPVSSLDIFPTALAAAGINGNDKKLDGINLLPALKDKDYSSNRALFWRYSDGAGYAIRHVNWKLVYSGYKQKFFLFDLSSDPYEQSDLTKSRPDMIENLLSLYSAWDENTIPAKWYDPHPENILKEENARNEVLIRASAGEKKW